jgi:hypothetical protein
VSDDGVVVRGELYLWVESVAATFETSTGWIAEACELGLIARFERIDGRLALSAVELDRVARLTHLHVHHGLDLVVAGTWVVAPGRSEP